ncbi:MAG: B12-binding domain-containing radical SAM protein [Deltaproteobacteria bacterium]|nr:B12-binding domain-containing radical SAM protein [Deltaproteobacteria bacterium]
MKGKNVLLINPWIYDFAAYDMWARPLGLLYIGSILKKNGCNLYFIDCLNTSHPYMKGKKPKRKPGGDGKFYREIIPKPDPLRDIPRYYSRYGITPEAFCHDLSKVARDRRIDVALITSMMTYWYPGVFDVIKIVKQMLPGVPVVLGGIYATLCNTHARKFSGADYIITHEGEIDILKLLAKLWHTKPVFVPEIADLDSYPYPCFDLIPDLRYVCIQTSRGCPFRCTYCASHLLTRYMRRRDPIKVVDEIECWNKKFYVKNFAFYDDSLLYGHGDFAIKMLKEIIKRELSCKFYCPNGLHARAINGEIASLMKDAGFERVCLGFETSDTKRQVETGAKTTTKELINSINCLHRAGYGTEDIRAYILCGLPYQDADDIKKAIDIVRSCGARPVIAEYSPIPNTGLWKDALKISPYPIDKEPLFQNNSLLPCQWEGLTYDMYKQLKIESGI